MSLKHTFKFAAIAAAILLAPWTKAEPEEKDFTPEFVAQCKAKAEAGDAEGMAIYGRALVNGWGVASNHVAAVEWLQKAAEAGNAIGQCTLGACYDNGEGVEKDAAQAVAWYRKAADQGFARAQLNLGLCYLRGDGVGKDAAQAVAWFHKAADLGDAGAQLFLGLCYLRGDGVGKDAAQAVAWFRKAADLGDAGAQLFLGNCYYNGIGVGKDAAQAVEWYRKAADQGLGPAQFLLGVCYAKGEGVGKDAALAVEWYRKAADQGAARAQFLLGSCYLTGEGVGKDAAQAVEWYRKAADQGEARAQFLLGSCYYKGEGVGEDAAQAVAWYRKAADQGFARAQFNLGLCYLLGDGVGKDAAQAVAWFRKAADLGDAEAQLYLGNCYYNGIGVEKDAAQAVAWYRKAADQGLARAQANLGLCYAEGEGVGKDAAQAVEWYRKAADLGDAEAQRFLGNCYYNGIGVGEDAAQAVAWYRKAADQGDARAQLNLGTCYFRGDGVREDVAQAVAWFRSAADQGDEAALRSLGSCYENGWGVEENMTQAVKWYRRAASANAPAKPSWTTNETERFWTSVASVSARVVTAPRTGAADAQKGEGMLEAFGTRYMPNVYGNYEKVRAKAIEREQMLKENFPEGEQSDTTSSGLFRKIATATAKAVSEYDRRRDELCHFYLMHKAGILTDAELAGLDESKISVMLPAAGETFEVWKNLEAWKNPGAPTPDELDFARKFKPETFAAYERLKALCDEGFEQLRGLKGDAVALDAVRSAGALSPLVSRLENVAGRLREIAKRLSEEKLLYDVEEITAGQLAEADAAFGIAIRSFEKTLPVRDYAKNWLAQNWTAVEWEAVAWEETPVFWLLQFAMVPIPGKDYAMCKYEVTQAQWEAVMGENPSRFKGADNPVENVSWDDCQEFLKKLNALPVVKESGLTFRLPTVQEWEYACRAGATGDYCRLADGTEITADTLGRVAWYKNNSGDKTHPVGQKAPNAFGLYDMHGNVWEWTSTADVASRGGWDDPAWGCKSSLRSETWPSERRDYRGFRLCSDKRQ